MKAPDRERILAQINELPSLSTIVSDLLASMGNENIDLERLAYQITGDQALTARVLRVANSSFYGLQRKVSTIQEAFIVLGFRAIRTMALAVEIHGFLHVDHCQGFDPQAHLRHSVAVGVVARELASLTGHNREVAFTAGILHDIGRLVLAANFSNEYEEALAFQRQMDCFPIQAERDVLGMDHCEIGGVLAEEWHFPATLREAMIGHHAPADLSADSIAGLIHVADAIAHGLGLAKQPNEMVMPVDRTAWQRLGLNSKKIGDILPQVMLMIEEANQAFIN